MVSLLWRVLSWGWLASEIVVGVVTRTKRSSGSVHDRGSLLILWTVIATAITASQWIAEIGPWSMFGGAHWPKTAGTFISRKPH
jgi:hypothetical protein